MGALLFVDDFRPRVIYGKRTRNPMVFVNTNEQTQRLYIPVPVPAGTGEGVTFQVRSTSDEVEVIFPVAEATPQGFTLALAVGLPHRNFHAGEWSYLLGYTGTDGEHYEATGLLTAEDRTPDASVQYNEQIRYKQYGE